MARATIGVRVRVRVRIRISKTVRAQASKYGWVKDVYMYPMCLAYMEV